VIVPGPRANDPSAAGALDGVRVVELGLPATPGLSDEPNIMSVLLVGTAMAAVNAIPFVCDARPGHTTPGRLPVFGARHRVTTGDS